MQNVDPQHLLELIRSLSSRRVIHTIEEGIEAEKRLLEANEALGNKKECKQIRERISDTKIFIAVMCLGQVSRVFLGVLIL